MNNVTTCVENVTPEMATTYLSQNIEKNRSINQNTVKNYARQMREGKWKLNGEAISFDNDGILINGQHRLSAVVKAGVPVPFVIVRGVDPSAFTTYDSGKNRTAKDIFSMSGIPSATHVSSVLQSYLKLRLHLISSDTDRYGARLVGENRPTKEELLNLYYDNESMFVEATHLGQKYYNQCHLMTISEIGGMYVYLIKEGGYQAAKIEEFFDGLLNLNNASYEHLVALRRILINNMDPKSRMSPRRRMALIIKAWNLFAEGKPVKRFFFNEETDNNIWFKYAYQNK